MTNTIRYKIDEEESKDAYSKGLNTLMDWIDKYAYDEPLLIVPLLEKTYKLWFGHHGIDASLIAFEKMSEELQEKFKEITND